MRKILVVMGVCLVLGWWYNAILADEEKSGPGTKYAVEVIAAKKLNLRNGPGVNFLIISTLFKGDKLLVVSEKAGWLEVQLPSKSPCWLTRELVDCKEEGKGVITANRVNVRITRDNQSSGNIIGQLNEGQEVTMVGEKDTWLKIAPVENLTGWISKKYTKYWGTVKDYQKWVEETLAKAQTETELKKNFKKAEEIYETENQKPPLDQDFTEALELYQEIVGQSADKELVGKTQARIQFIQPRQQILSDYRQAVAQKDVKIEELRKKYYKQIEKITKEKRETSPYQAEGWVESMGKVFGRPGTHQLVKGGEVLCYLKSTTVDFDDYYKRYVGVRGQEIEAEGWSRKTIIVEEIDILETE